MGKGAELATDGLQCLDRSDGRNPVSPQSPLPLGLDHFAWWQQDKGRPQATPGAYQERRMCKLTTTVVVVYLRL